MKRLSWPTIPFLTDQFVWGWEAYSLEQRGNNIATLTIKDNIVYANSRDVAEYFGKRHDHIITLIDGLVMEDATTPPNFRECALEAKSGFGIRKFRAYDLTRDGFTELVMGFTGAKARQFKRAS